MGSTYFEEGEGGEASAEEGASSTWEGGGIVVILSNNPYDSIVSYFLVFSFRSSSGCTPVHPAAHQAPTCKLTKADATDFCSSSLLFSSHPLRPTQLDMSNSTNTTPHYTTRPSSSTLSSPSPTKRQRLSSPTPSSTLSPLVLLTLSTHLHNSALSLLPLQSEEDWSAYQRYETGAIELLRRVLSLGEGEGGVECRARGMLVQLLWGAGGERERGEAERVAGKGVSHSCAREFGGDADFGFGVACVCAV